MKKLIALTILVLAGAMATFAQTNQSANEGFVGLSAMRQNLDTYKVNRDTFRVNGDTDSVGFNAAYTRYFGGDKSANKVGVLGLTSEIDAQFHNKEESKVALVSASWGLTLKARNAKYVQPYVRALAGVGRRDFGGGIAGRISGAESTGVYTAGAGLDFNTKAYSRYKIRVGADYVNTGWGDSRQNNVRFTTGLVF